MKFKFNTNLRRLYESYIPANPQNEALLLPPFSPQVKSKLQLTIAQSNSHLSKHTKRKVQRHKPSKRSQANFLIFDLTGN
jgi:hypothetical protein